MSIANVANMFTCEVLIDKDSHLVFLFGSFKVAKSRLYLDKLACNHKYIFAIMIISTFKNIFLLCTICSKDIRAACLPTVL